MPMAKVEAFNSPDAMKPDQKVVKQEKEEHDSIDHFIKQAVSFSRPTENPVQWIQLLQALDQQGSNKVSNGSKVDNCLGGREQSLDPYNGVSICHSAVNGFKESVHSLKGNGISAKGTKSTYEQMQALKIPEAVVAFAQAAAKANGEPEKYLPGWPLLSPSKVQLQRCDKCSREFCSPINYRRHTRVHRRSLNIDKDSPKNRVLLGTFWDKLSMDEAMEIASFKDVVIEETTGSSIIKALTSLIRKPGFSSLPHVYLKAGSTLLDIVQGKPSIFPISFQEFFSVLDDASEKTFLCAGTAVSMQKFVFDGDAGKIALEMRNLVACTSFLLEQKLVKAWLADKDAEALRYQKLLVEEEEAARKRQADLVERKRLKKLRQKEQRLKEYSENKSALKTGSSDNLERTPSPGARSETELQNPESPNMCPIILETTSSVHVDAGPSLRRGLHAENAAENSENGIQMGAQRAHTSSVCHLVMKPSRNVPNGFHLGQISETKSSAFMKHGNLRDSKAVALGHGHKVWTPKTKSNEEEGTIDRDKSHRECKGWSEMFDKSVVLIGSISVTLGGNNAMKKGAFSLKWNHPEEKLSKSDSCTNRSNRFLVKQWRPVGRNDNENSSTAQICKGDTKLEVFPAEGTTQVEFDESSFTSRHSDANGQLSPDECCLSSGDSYAQLPVHERSCSSGGADNHSGQRCDDLLIVNGSQVRPFSCDIAEAFLTQRWKEAMASEHVKLVLAPETEALENLDISQSRLAEALVKESDCRERTILGSAENRVDRAASPCTGVLKTKFRAKPEKNYRIKYVPKQRNNG